MEKLIRYAEQYIKESDWKSIGLLKLCLLSLGICVGLTVPSRKKPGIFLIAIFVFLVTLIPLLMKYLRIIRKDEAAGRRD